MSRPEQPSETPAPSVHSWSTQPEYSNLGEMRAHLQPSKACRLQAPRSLSANPKPPPLPQKTLTRTQSLPTYGTPGPSSASARQTHRLLLASHSMDQSQGGDGQGDSASSPAELTFSTPDAELGGFFQDLHDPEAVQATLAAQQLASLRGIQARLHRRLAGGHPGPCHSSHGFRLLDNSPCVDSGDFLYYRVVRVDGDSWHILAAKVPKPGVEVPNPWALELQASLTPHFNLQSLCGTIPDRGLPAAPWCGPAALVAEVPERTMAQWLAEVREQRPPEFARVAALLLLQLSAALESLEAHGGALAQLRPENLLLATPRGCTGPGLPRLLLADFGRVHRRPTGALGAHARPLGRLLRLLLELAAAPRPAPLVTGLERLAAQLPRRLPSAAQTRGALRALLWGPGPGLRGHAAPLGSWLRVRRALLALRLAERAAGGEAPGLEDWLCCEYLAEATEGSLAPALALLWD